MNAPVILWWGRGDPRYSRNRIVREHLHALGFQLEDFRPRLAVLGDVEAWLSVRAQPRLVWVPCFRQRDVRAAARWSRRRGVPLIFDPLISAYDKQVFERGKFAPDSAGARRLLAWERRCLRQPTLVIADTEAHAAYFMSEFGIPPQRVAVVMVGAEEELFHPRPLISKPPDTPLEVLFYGSFISLQGPEVIVEAARCYKGPPVQWTLLGHGPLQPTCRAAARALPHVRFEPWIAYEELPARIHRADILLGVFGGSEKAGRVIPNKVFQALACGRPVITRQAAAYPTSLQQHASRGLRWVVPNDARALAAAVAELAAHREELPAIAEEAAAIYRVHFSAEIVCGQLRQAMERILPAPR